MKFSTAQALIALASLLSFNSDDPVSVDCIDFDGFNVNLNIGITASVIGVRVPHVVGSAALSLLWCAGSSALLELLSPAA